MIRITVKTKEGVDHVVEIEEGSPEAQFDEVIKKARGFITNGKIGSHMVTVESRDIYFQLIHHNDFGGHLLIGGPKPNRKSWGDMGCSNQKSFGNNVRVMRRWVYDKGQHQIVAVFSNRVLNEFWADDLSAAEEKYQLLCGTWGKATPDNLRDEVQDCPGFTPWW